jgi:hypothetical protein
MSKWLSIGLSALLVAAVGATQAEGQSEKKKVKRDRYVILPDEIAEKNDITNAYDAIQRLRPQWLKSSRVRMGSGSGGSSASDPYKPEPLSAAGRSGERSTESEGRVSAPPDSRRQEAVMAVAYIDDVKQHELEEIRNIRIAEVAEIRYMTGNEATGRYGDGHSAGAILIKTTRSGRP